MLWRDTDPCGRSVRLAVSTWRTHIAVDHPEVANHLDGLRSTVRDPDYIVLEKRPRGTSSLYYVRGAIPGRYQRLLLTVVVEWENDRTGCVKTSYVTDDPLIRGTVEWVREKR
jgi:hypothetical protein